MTYTPCHVHTTFSLLDSCIKIPELIKRLKDLNIKSCAITDHGNMHGAIEFYLACKEAGIKALVGVEAYCTENPPDSEEPKRDNYHLVLLPKNEKGLNSLFHLLNQATLHNFYYKPRIYRPMLEEHGENLVALSACLANYIGRLCRFEQSVQRCFVDDYNQLRQVTNWFRRTFPDSYYIEIQDHPSSWEQVAFNQIIVEYAHAEKIPIVITSDAHYLTREDFPTHEMLIALQMKMTLEQYRMQDSLKYSETNYIRSVEEMTKAAASYGAPEAVENTNRVADQCNCVIETGVWKTPIFDVSKAGDYPEFLSWKKEKK